MAASSKRFSFPFILMVAGYALAILEFTTFLAGGFRSKSGAWLRVRPEISRTLCSAFFAFGTIFLIVTIVRAVKRTNADEAKRRWRGRALSILLLPFIAVGFSSVSISAQTKPKGVVIATGFRIKNPSDSQGSELFITVGGRERMIDRQARQAWLIEGGRRVVFAANDGAGGFENEGQSLRIYDVATRRVRKIMSEYEVVDAVMETKLTNGKTALLVKMSDGGAGISTFVVVDPARGEVFKRDFTELTKIDGDTITLARYRRGDWDAINEERGWFTNIDPNVVLLKAPKVNPERTETFDLKTTIAGRVIYNKPTNRF